MLSKHTLASIYKTQKKNAEIVNAINFAQMKMLIFAFSQCAQILAAFQACIAFKSISANAKQFETINNNDCLHKLNEKNKNQKKLEFFGNKSDKIAA